MSVTTAAFPALSRWVSRSLRVHATGTPPSPMTWPVGSGRRRRHRRGQVSDVVVTALVAVLALIFTGLASTAGAAPSGRTCTDLDLPVSSGPLTATMHATLCQPDGGSSAVALQVLVPGGTYNRTYWSGLGIDAYSYTARAAAAGFATLAVDRIGTGGSSQPLSAVITMDIQADALHDVVTRARTEGLNGHRYSKVALVGHSMGSMASVLAASRYPGDVDAVILTGYSHRIAAGPLLTGLSSMHPAVLEGRPLDPGYLTTIPGKRARLFHALDNVDPAVVAADEATKDVASVTELPGGLLAGLSPAVSRRITAPVLEANGSRDTWACTVVDCTSAETLRAAEQPAFSVELTTYVQPRAGHSLALAADGGEFADFASTWLNKVFFHDDVDEKP